MKKIITLFVLFLALYTNHSSAQAITVISSDTSIVNYTDSQSGGTIVGSIFLINTRDSAVVFLWRSVGAGTYGPDGWQFYECDNANCYSNIGSIHYSNPVLQGDTLDMHSQSAPNCVAGSGQMQISLQVVGDPSPPIVLTYIATVTSTCYSPAGINPLEAAEISIYPNPANDQLTISGFEPGHTIEAQVFDVQGKMIIAEKQTPSLNMQLDINPLTSGLYIVKIFDTQNNLSTVRKISKL